MIDANVYLSRWPFRRLAFDEPTVMTAALRKRGVTQAWAGSFDALLHKDIAAVNLRLAADCAQHGAGLFKPFGAVNPTLPDWRDDLRRVHEVHHMPGIRLHPNYHGYTLDQPVAAELLAAAANRGLAVQIVLSMEDERTQHPLLRVPPVNAEPLAGLVKTLPSLRLMILNAGRVLPRIPGAYFDFAMQEGPYAVSNVIAAVGQDRTVFGSYSPMFYFESAQLKVKEAGLGKDVEHAILDSNAQRLLTR